MEEVYIISSCRTPIGSFNGCFSKVPASILGSIVIKNCLDRAEIDPADVSEVIMGQVLTAGQGQNPARQAALRAKLPNNIPAYTVNMLCGSGLKAIVNAYNAIKIGDASIIVAGGQENMTLSEHTVYLRKGQRFGNGELKDSLLCDGLTDASLGIHMGLTAEHLATEYKKSRDEQDSFALNSQLKTKLAQENGYFVPEIVPVEYNGITPVTKDEYPKNDTTKDGLGKLKTVFKANGSVTAGNASGINDGAAAVVLCSGTEVRSRKLKPEAVVVACAQVACDPIEMGLAPIHAIKKALTKANWAIDDVDLYEINEAFAVQSLLVIEALKIDLNKVNICGGAIALGHPIGASGGRVVVTLLHNMKRLNKTKGVAALCVGGGMGIAIAIERKF